MQQAMRLASSRASVRAQRFVALREGRLLELRQLHSLVSQEAVAVRRSLAELDCPSSTQSEKRLMSVARSGVKEEGICCAK